MTRQAYGLDQVSRHEFPWDYMVFDPVPGLGRTPGRMHWHLVARDRTDRNLMDRVANALVGQQLSDPAAGLAIVLPSRGRPIRLGRHPRRLRRSTITGQNPREQAVSPDEVADCILFALTRPLHVNVDEIVIKALQQSSGARIVRREE